MLKINQIFDKISAGGFVMSEKKNTKKPNSRNFENEETKKNTRIVERDYTLLLNKIVLCLYAIIFLLIINTTILLLKNAKFGTVDDDSNKNNGADISTEYDVSMFSSVTAETLKDETEKDELQIVYIGRSTCGFCIQFLPILQQAQKDYDYKTLYLDITTVTTTEQQDRILELDNEEEFLDKNFGSTPMVLLMKNSEIIDTSLGYKEYSEYSEWLEKNGFEKKNG